MIEKNVLANFLNGPISKNSIFFSKIFPEKVMVINFCFIVIYQLNISMTPTRLEKINFSSLCKIFKNAFFLNHRILMEDKIDSNLNHISYIRISKKNIEMFYFIKLKFEP